MTKWLQPWSGLFKEERQNTLELMDLPETPQAEFEKALVDIQWVNRHLKGSQTLIEGLQSLIKTSPSRTFQVLDLGTGSADIPIALVQWGQTRNIHFEITAVDDHPVAAAVAHQNVQNYPNIQIMQGDALALDYPDAHFDIVMSSMFLHHLNNQEAVHLLQEMSRLSRIGFVVNDLERSPLAYFGIQILGKLFNKGKVFLNDAPLSVLRGFTVQDIQHLKALSTLDKLQIMRRKPYRLLLVEHKDD